MDYIWLCIFILFLYLMYVVVKKGKESSYREERWKEEIKKQNELQNLQLFYEQQLEMLKKQLIIIESTDRIQDFFDACTIVDSIFQNMNTHERDDLNIQIDRRDYNKKSKTESSNIMRYSLREFENTVLDERQWHLRDVIERHSHAAIEKNKNLYRNSKERQHQVYMDFVQGIREHANEIDEETLEFFSKMEQNVFLSTDRNLSRFQIIENAKQQAAFERTSIQEIDNMSGEEFEQFCAFLLRSSGFQNVIITKTSGDQGVDILAENDGIKYAIQCKCYSSPLSNKPVQEVHAGKDIYSCHVGVVLTNSTFTSGAIDAANKTNTLLWDRNVLIEMISKQNR